MWNCACDYETNCIVTKWRSKQIVENCIAGTDAIDMEITVAVAYTVQFIIWNYLQNVFGYEI
jgi:hypothetical protein